MQSSMEITGNKPQRTVNFTGHTDIVWCICPGPEETIYTGGEDGTVRVWNMLTGESIQVFEGHKGAVCGLFYLEETLYSASTDKTIISWSSTGELQRTYTGAVDSIRCVTANAEVVVGGVRNGALALWWGETKQPQTLQAHSELVSVVAFASNDDVTLLFSASYDKSIKAWELNADTGKYVEYQSFRGHNNHVKSLSFLGNTMFSSSRDQTIRFWNTKKKDPEAPKEEVAEQAGNLQCVVNLSSFVNVVQVVGNQIYCGCSDGKIRVLNLKDITERITQWNTDNAAKFNAQKKKLEEALAAKIKKLEKQKEKTIKKRQAELHPEKPEGEEDDEERPPPAEGEEDEADAHLESMREQLTKELEMNVAVLQRDLEAKLKKLETKIMQHFDLPNQLLTDGKSNISTVMHYEGPSVLSFVVAEKSIYIGADCEMLKIPSSMSLKFI
eukprot:TRINITY_DN67615_c9_g1_i1.p1 TRINITY_DN67615_c9_g1~~TRINITY_DN67615_c9_g1_i1.p1  ORF type:complete len:442 (-),score=65.92 TRINITY_DN67615_c9_g1_i1:1112-2437(-)